MNKYTKESLAKLLNGNEYGDEISKEQEADAKASGLVIAFGYSDDNIELRGAISDEIGCYGGSDIKFDLQGALPEFENLDEEEAEQYFRRKHGVRLITANWDTDGYSWTYATDIPHSTFDVMEDGDKYCRAIVFSIDDAFSKTECNVWRIKNQITADRIAKEAKTK